MAIAVPVLVLTSGVRELLRLTLSLGRIVGIGAQKSARVASRSAGHAMRAIVQKARTVTLKAGPSGFVGAVRPTLGFLEFQKAGRFVRVVNILIPDSLLFALFPGDKASRVPPGRGAIEGFHDDRLFRLAGGSGRQPLAFRPSFERELQDRLEQAQRELEKDVEDWIFRSG